MYFANPQAVLPVLKKDGSLILLPWGRRPQQAGKLPFGGWARLASIYAGSWDQYFPKPLKVPLLSFMAKDLSGQSHWYDVKKGQYLQGLLANEHNEQRVHLVILDAEISQLNIHSCWPRVVQTGEKSMQAK